SSDGAGVKAHLSVEPSTAYVNSIVIFNATGSEGDIETYIWEFGDGNNLTTSSPVCNHTYSKPGTYFVNLTVVGPGGETDNVSEIVVIKESWKKDIPGFGILLTLFLLVIIVIMRRRT
ncbi:MAG: PKD domain-containing protein, partial [Thermoplasmata archaeon]